MAEKEEKTTDDGNKVMPAGDAAPEKTDKVEATGTDNAAEKADAALKEATEKLDALTKEHENLQGLYGTQSNEVGESRNAITALTQQVETLTGQVKDMAKSELTSDETRRAEIYEKMNDGDMSIADGMRQLEEIHAADVERIGVKAADAALETARAEFTNALTERDSNKMRQKFMEANPDFVELQKTGALEGIKRENPMHDDFSAYYALKETQAFDRGKEEQSKIQKGLEVTNKGLKKPGGAIRQLNKPDKPLTDKEQIARGVQVLENAEEAAGQG